MNIAETTVPDSTQVNAEDLLPGPVTVTVAGVERGTSEQPVNVVLVEYPGRAYRPSKTMRRVMVAAWGPDSDTYAGKRLTLFRDPTVSFGRDVVGGIKISHMSGLDAPLKIALTISRGKRAVFKVDPLPDVPVVDLGAITDQNELRDLWNTRPDLRDTITARVNELKEQS